MPFLLNDAMDAVGQLVVVPDERWDEFLALVREIWLYDDKDVTIVETEKGPFAVIPDEDIDPEKLRKERESGGV